MAGAGHLAALAAARSGAGMVRRLTSAEGNVGLDAIVTANAKTTVEIADALADDRVSAVVVGPGLGLDGQAEQRLATVMACGRPLVLDADALTLIGRGEVGTVAAGSILTPHEGEFSRLFPDLRGDKIIRARRAAQRMAAVIVLKGMDSVIAAPDGRTAITTGVSSWLSTAGTGDVLAGLIAGRLAVTRDAFRAACEGVWLHGEAARRAGAAFAADDLIAHLPAAIASRL